MKTLINIKDVVVLLIIGVLTLILTLLIKILSSKQKDSLIESIIDKCTP